MLLIEPVTVLRVFVRLPAYPFPPWLWRYTSAEGRDIYKSTAVIRSCITEEVKRALGAGVYNVTRSDNGGTSVPRISLLNRILQSSAESRFTEDQVVEDLTAFMVQRYSVLGQQLLDA